MSKKTTQKEKVQFLKSDINLNPARLKGESFDNYKTRRRQGNEAVKRAIKGRLVWISAREVPIYSKLKKDGKPQIIGYKKVLVKGTYQGYMKEDKI